MKVIDAMTKDVVTISPDDSLESAIDVFSKNRISGAPVTGVGGKLVGVLSESDIIKGIGIKNILSFNKNEVKKIKKTVEELDIFVGRIMNRIVHSIKEDESLVEAVKTMNAYDINRLPVVDKKGNLTGILTRGDVIRAIARQEAAKQEVAKHEAVKKEVKLEKSFNVKEVKSLETDVDRFLKIIEEKGSITIENVAKLLNVPEERVEEWGKIFEEHKLVKLEYPPLGKPVLKKMK